MDNYQRNLEEIAKGGGNYSHRVLEEREDKFYRVEPLNINVEESTGKENMRTIEESAVQTIVERPKFLDQTGQGRGPRQMKYIKIERRRA